MGSKARKPIAQDPGRPGPTEATQAVAIMAAPPTAATQISNKDTFKELVGEAVGVEKGFLRTIVDLTKRPADVVESYLNGEHTYLNPFRLQFSIATVWVVVMNFILDWEAIGREYAHGLYEMFPAPTSAGGAERLADTELLVGTMFDALFAKYFIILVIIFIPIQALLCTRFTRPLGIPFKKHLSVLAYQGSIKLGVGFIVAVGFGVHVIATMAIMFALVIAGLLGWKFASNVMSGIPVQKFFREGQREIDKAYRKAGGVVLVGAVLLGMLFGLAYGVIEKWS